MSLSMIILPNLFKLSWHSARTKASIQALHFSSLYHYIPVYFTKNDIDLYNVLSLLSKDAS